MPVHERLPPFVLLFNIHELPDGLWFISHHTNNYNEFVSSMRGGSWLNRVEDMLNELCLFSPRNSSEVNKAIEQISRNGLVPFFVEVAQVRFIFTANVHCTVRELEVTA